MNEVNVPIPIYLNFDLNLLSSWIPLESPEVLELGEQRAFEYRAVLAYMEP